MAEWKIPQTIPITKSAAWTVRAGKQQITAADAVEFERLLDKWHPFSNLYAAAPFSDCLTSVVNIPDLERALRRAHLRRTACCSAILFVTTVFLALIGELRDQVETICSALATLMALVFIWFDYLIISSSPESLKKYSNFFLWLRELHARRPLFWFSAMALFGVFQLALQALNSWDLDALITHFGVEYSKLSEGQLWRLILGPFIHANFTHWLSNLASVCVAAVLAFSLSRKTTFMIVLISSIVGASVAWNTASLVHDDAYVGLSAGIFGLYGSLITLALRTPEEYPPRYWLWLLGLTVLDLSGSAILSANVSNSGHFSGLVTGLALGLVLPKSGNTGCRSERLLTSSATTQHEVQNQSAFH